MSPRARPRAGRIIIVRHGQTALNAAGRLRGLQDPPLDEVGQGQAAAVASRLAGEPIERVLASPLIRAVETAQPIAASHGLNVEIDSGLLDIDYGPWTAKTWDEVAAEDPIGAEAFLERPMSASTPIESVASVLERFTEALRLLAQGNALTVAVSHDLPIRALLAALDHSGDQTFWGAPLPNCAIVVIDASPDGALQLAQ